MTDVCNEFQGMSTEVSEEAMSLLERFVVVVHDRTSDSIDVNDARKQLITHKFNTLEIFLQPRASEGNSINNIYLIKGLYFFIVLLCHLK